MVSTERLKTVSKSVDSLRLRADDHSEEALLEEALAREGQTVLLLEKLLAEVHIIFNLWEHVQFYLDHHVHGCTTTDWSHTRD